MIKNRLILTGIFIEMGVIEIEYEANKIKVFIKIDEEPTLLRNTQLPNALAYTLSNLMIFHLSPEKIAVAVILQLLVILFSLKTLFGT